MIKYKKYIPILCLILLVFLVFSTSLYFPFFGNFDDSGYITKNAHLNFTLDNIKYWFTHACVGCYLPLTMLSYMFDYSVWGLNSFGYHLQNIFWHIVTVIAVYKCFRLFDIKSWIAFFICLIFAIHPQRVESVVWISERKDVLCATFYFLSIYFYLNKTSKNSEHINSFPTLSFIFFILAIFSKPMAVSLPVILLIFELSRRVRSREWRVAGDNDRSTINNKQRKEQRDKSKEQNSVISDQSSVNSKTTNQQINKVRRLIPFFIVLVIFIPISIITQSNAGAIQQSSSIFSINRLFSVVYNIYWYFTQTFVCTENSPLFHPHIANFYSITELILFYSGTIIIIVYLYIKNNKFFFAIVLPLILAYLITLLPVSGIIKLGPTDHADRYSYIPSFFIWLPAGLILTRTIINRKLVYIILLFYSVILITLNIQYQRFWKNNYTLFSYATSFYHVNAHILISLADIEMDKKKFYRVLELIKDLDNDPYWKPIADFYKISILYNFDKNRSIKPLLELKIIFEKNFHRKIFRAKYPIIIEMLKSTEKFNHKLK